MLPVPESVQKFYTDKRHTELTNLYKWKLDLVHNGDYIKAKRIDKVFKRMLMLFL